MSKRSRLQLESYRKLVMMQAWKAWRRLPMQTRIWINVEDMIEDGMREAWKLTTVYNPRWASFTTALFHRLHKFYINNYIEFYSAQQRGWTRINGTLKPIPQYSLQAMESHMKIKNANSSLDDVVGQIPELVVSADSIVDNAVTECFVVPALEEVYKEASPRLKDMFVTWFLTTNETRNHKKGKPFKKAAAEFRELCSQQNVNLDDCLHLVRSPGCLDTLSRNVLGKPYFMDYPTPQVERVL